MPAHKDDFTKIGTHPEPIMEAFEIFFDFRHDELKPTSCLGLEWEKSELRTIKTHLKRNKFMLTQNLILSSRKQDFQ